MGKQVEAGEILRRSLKTNMQIQNRVKKCLRRKAPNALKYTQTMHLCLSSRGYMHKLLNVGAETMQGTNSSTANKGVKTDPKNGNHLNNSSAEPCNGPVCANPGPGPRSSVLPAPGPPFFRLNLPKEIAEKDWRQDHVGPRLQMLPLWKGGPRPEPVRAM